MAVALAAAIFTVKLVVTSDYFISIYFYESKMFYGRQSRYDACNQINNSKVIPIRTKYKVMSYCFF